MMAPMPSKSPSKRPAFMLSVTAESDSSSPVASSPPSTGKMNKCYVARVYRYYVCILKTNNIIKSLHIYVCIKQEISRNVRKHSRKKQQ